MWLKIPVCPPPPFFLLQGGCTEQMTFCRSWTYVIAQCDMLELDTEVEYMMELGSVPCYMEKVAGFWRSGRNWVLSFSFIFFLCKLRQSLQNIR